MTGANLSRVLSSEALILSTKDGAWAGLEEGDIVSEGGSGVAASGCRFSGEFSVGGRSFWVGFRGEAGWFWFGGGRREFPEALFVRRGEVVLRFRIVYGACKKRNSSKTEYFLEPKLNPKQEGLRVKFKPIKT